MNVVLKRTDVEMETRRTTNVFPESVESPRGKLVYFFLRTRDGATVAELEDGLELPKITLLGVLKALEERDVVARDGDQYVTARPA